MLIFSMSVSIDGYVTDRDGGIDWSDPPSDELFGFHLERVRGLGAHLCGRRLFQTMLPWETDPAMRSTPLQAEFADVWAALPKTVFSRTLTHVGGRARLATGSVADEVASTLAATDRDVEIGGAQLAAQALRLGLVDELRVFRVPVVLGGGTPYLPALAAPARFELVESRVFDGSVVHERYRRVVSTTS